MRGTLVAIALVFAACNARRSSHGSVPDANDIPIGTFHGAISFTDSTELPISSTVVWESFGGNTTLIADERAILVTIDFGWQGTDPLAAATYNYQVVGGTVAVDDAGLVVQFRYPDTKHANNIVEAMPTNAWLKVDPEQPPHMSGTLDAQADAAHLHGTFVVTLPGLF